MDFLTLFPPGVTLHITVVFPGEYRVGWQTADRIYLPGSGSYYSLEEALERAWKVFQKLPQE